MLLTGKGDTPTVDGIATDNVEDFRILLAWGSECFPARRNIVKEIFNLVDISLTRFHVL